MHSLRGGIIGKLGGLAALYAILLLSLVPVVSQMLTHERVEPLMAVRCASGSTPRSEALEQMPHASHVAPGHLNACGYCELLAHAPAPPSALHDDGASIPVSDRFVALHEAKARPRASHVLAQPRAPPSGA